MILVGDSVYSSPYFVAFIALAIIFYMSNVYIVFVDAKTRNISHGYAGLPLVLGGLGGLIYYFIITDFRHSKVV